MAELLIKRANDNCQLGCYSERGVMSYFMFVVLPTWMGRFLDRLEFPADVPRPFASFGETNPKSIVYSELCLGSEGFGSPDGAIFVDCENPFMIFIEAKANDKYAESCSPGKEYNSTIQGQLELKWRMCSALHSGGVQEHDGELFIMETPSLKATYAAGDRFYGAAHRQNEDWRGAWRRLKVIEGVAEFVKNLAHCEDRVYFCAITADEQNPFDFISGDLLPRTGNIDWETAKRSFCWLPFERIRNAEVGELEVSR